MVGIVLFVIVLARMQIDKAEGPTLTMAMRVLAGLTVVGGIGGMLFAQSRVLIEDKFVLIALFGVALPLFFALPLESLAVDSLTLDSLVLAANDTLLDSFAERSAAVAAFLLLLAPPPMFIAAERRTTCN